MTEESMEKINEQDLQMLGSVKLAVVQNIQSGEFYVVPFISAPTDVADQSAALEFVRDLLTPLAEAAGRAAMNLLVNGGFRLPDTPVNDMPEGGVAGVA